MLRASHHILQADFASHHSSCVLHTTRPASLQASHHTSCELHTTRPGSRFGCTPLVLQAYMLHTTHTASFTPHVLQADLLHTTCPVRFTPLVLQAYIASHHSSCKHIHASHHTSRKPTCFTSHVLQAALLHTTHPVSLHASHHKSCELYTTHSGSRFGFTPLVLRTSHHTSCKPTCFTRPETVTSFRVQYLLPSPRWLVNEIGRSTVRTGSSSTTGHM